MPVPSEGFSTEALHEGERRVDSFLLLRTNPFFTINAPRMENSKKLQVPLALLNSRNLANL